MIATETDLVRRSTHVILATVEENVKQGPIIVRWRPWVELLQPDGLVPLERAAPAAGIDRG